MTTIERAVPSFTEPSLLPPQIALGCKGYNDLSSALLSHPPSYRLRPQTINDMTVKDKPVSQFTEMRVWWLTIETWSRLIRFIPGEKIDPSLPWLWGEPVDFNLDIGLAMSKTPPQVVKVRPWRMINPWDEDAEMSDAVLTVKILLTPLSRGTGDIRAVGLNYKDHAVSPS